MNGPLPPVSSCERSAAGPAGRGVVDVVAALGAVVLAPRLVVVGAALFELLEHAAATTATLAVVAMSTTSARGRGCRARRFQNIGGRSRASRAHCKSRPDD